MAITLTMDINKANSLLCHVTVCKTIMGQLYNLNPMIGYLLNIYFQPQKIWAWYKLLLAN